jgi:hypothetical protein
MRPAAWQHTRVSQAPPDTACCPVLHPAHLVQVDDRLNGDGVGFPLGVSDPALGWVIGGVATLIWIAYFIAQKDFGNFEDDDSGVGL